MINLVAIAKAIEKFFDFRKSKIDNQIASEVLNDKDKLEKACDCAEKVFKLIDEYCYFDNYNARRRYDYLVDKFRKYN